MQCCAFSLIPGLYRLKGHGRVSPEIRELRPALQPGQRWRGWSGRLAQNWLEEETETETEEETAQKKQTKTGRPVGEGAGLCLVRNIAEHRT